MLSFCAFSATSSSTCLISWSAWPICSLEVPTISSIFVPSGRTPKRGPPAPNRDFTASAYISSCSGEASSVAEAASPAAASCAVVAATSVAASCAATAVPSAAASSAAAAVPCSAVASSSCSEDASSSTGASSCSADASGSTDSSCFAGAFASFCPPFFPADPQDTATVIIIMTASIAIKRFMDRPPSFRTCS